MMGIAAYQHGIYPRSEELIAKTRDFERGRTSAGAVRRQVETDEVDFITIQTNAGLDYISDGLHRFQDIFRPLVDAAPGMQPGGLIRWFNNNSFFRTPEITGAVQLNSDLPSPIAEARKPSAPRVVTLPSPFTFSRAATTRGDRDSLMIEIARYAIRPVAELLAAEGVELIHLSEPWLGFFGIEEAPLAAFEEAVASIAGGLDAKVILHIYFGDCSAYAQRLAEPPLHALGIDFVESDLDQLGSGWEVGVAAGVINGRTSALEDPHKVVEFCRQVIDRLEPPVFYLTSNSELELLPRAIAREKVLNLGRCARALKESAS